MIFEEVVFLVILLPTVITSILEVRAGLERAISPVNLTVWFVVVVVAIPATKLEGLIDSFGLRESLRTIYLFLSFVMLGVLFVRFVRRFGSTIQQTKATSVLASPPSSRPIRTVDRAPFWIALAVGLAGYGLTIFLSGGPIAYYSAVHLRGLDQSISAYIYSLQYLIAPSVLVLAVANRLAGRRQNLIVILAFLFLLFDAYILGRRGTYIRLAVGMVIFFLSIRHTLSPQSRIMSRITIILSVALLSAIIYITPVIRHSTALGQSFNLNQILEELSHRDVLAGSTDDSGNELVYASSLIAATDEYGIDFGKKWLYPFISLVPRQIWPNKPYYTNFSANNVDLIYSSSGIEIARGAAPTFVADTYARFGLFGAAVFLALVFPLDRKLRSMFAGWFNIEQLAFGYLATVSFIYFLLQDFSQGMLHFIYAALPLKFLIWFTGRAKRLNLT